MGYIQGIGLWNSSMSIKIPLLLQSASGCRDYSRPPGIQVGPNRVEIQGHFKYLGSITLGNGG